MVRFCKDLTNPKSIKFLLDTEVDPETGKSEVDLMDEFAISRRCTVSKAVRDIVLEALSTFIHQESIEPEQYLDGNGNGNGNGTQFTYRAGGKEPSFADNPMVHEAFVKNARFPVNVLKGRTIAGKKFVKIYEKQTFVQEDEDYKRDREEMLRLKREREQEQKQEQEVEIEVEVENEKQELGVEVGAELK